MMCMLLRRWMAAVAVLWAAQKDRERPVEIGGGSGPYFYWYLLVFSWSLLQGVTVAKFFAKYQAKIPVKIPAEL